MPTYKMEGTFTGTITEVVDPNPPDPNLPDDGVFQLGDVPFSAESSWNRKVPTNATYKNIAWPAATPYNYISGWGSYTPAVYVAADGDPVVQVEHPDSWGTPAGKVPMRIKKGVTGAGGTDGELLAVDGDVVHNMWQFKRTSDTTATCSAYAKDNVKTGTGWGTKSPFLGAGITAVGGSMLAGLLVEEETKTGEIKHALQLVVDEVLIKPGQTGEAINSDGGAANGIVQEADHLAIPRNVAMPSGMSPLGQACWRAAQEYGAFVIDKAGMCSKVRMQLNAYSQDIANKLTPDLGKIIPALKKIG
jgi:hypothetical protein